MTSPSTSHAEDAELAGATSGHAFGLRVDSPFPLIGLACGIGPGDRRVQFSVRSAEELASWPGGDAKTLVDRRFDDGSPWMQVDFHPEHGYRLWALGHGSYVVSADGTTVGAAIPAAPTLHWERFVFAQVLPLAAALQGLEVFHASAVAIEEQAIAFIAASGTGKTTIAVHLRSYGGILITDDVLAVEASPHGLYAHAGAALLNIDRADLATLEHESGAVGPIVGGGDKVNVLVETLDHAVPLRAVFFVDRDASIQQIRIEKLAGPQPSLLLGSSFLPYLDTEAHLRTHLEICAELAQSVQTYRLSLPGRSSASDVAQRVLRTLDSKAGRA